MRERSMVYFWEMIGRKTSASCISPPEPRQTNVHGEIVQHIVARIRTAGKEHNFT